MSIFFIFCQAFFWFYIIYFEYSAYRADISTLLSSVNFNALIYFDTVMLSNPLISSMESVNPFMFIRVSYPDFNSISIYISFAVL